MLNNPKWQLDADLSLLSLVAWLEQQPPGKTYAFADSDFCLLAQWLKSMDPDATSSPIEEGSFAYQFRGETIWLNHYRGVAIPKIHERKNCTFGAALERARAA